jgi:hypothetical protein
MKIVLAGRGADVLDALVGVFLALQRFGRGVNAYLVAVLVGVLPALPEAAESSAAVAAAAFAVFCFLKASQLAWVSSVVSNLHLRVLMMGRKLSRMVSAKGFAMKSASSFTSLWWSRLRV